ncbi:HAMP domain-containing protein [Serratia marcescens]
MKRLLAPLSIVNQVALLMLLSGILGVAGMGISAWMSQSIQGNAHAINKAGSLRMQSYRLLAQVPLDERHETLIRELERDENSPDLQRSVEQEGLTQPFDALRDYWQQTLQPRLRSAQRPADAAPQVAHFVQLLDKLVSDIDRQTERRLLMVTLVQAGFIALTLLLLFGTTCYLRRRLLHPWRQLVEMALAVGRGDFSRRYAQRGHQDEMASLGGALNTMSDELSATYSGLEQRVAEKTADLQQKNQVLSFLYRASRQLRELLTTFRLQLTEPGLLAALQSTVAEFNPKLGLTISLDYQLGPRTVPAYQAIHLLQIAREALSNILKHAAASEVSIQVINKRGEVTLSVCDNGRGLPAETSRPDHYGLIIMRDRAKSLHGRCDILPRSGGGTEVRVSFTPDNHAID